MSKKEKDFEKGYRYGYESGVKGNRMSLAFSPMNIFRNEDFLEGQHRGVRKGENEYLWKMDKEYKEKQREYNKIQRRLKLKKVI